MTEWIYRRTSHSGRLWEPPSKALVARSKTLVHPGARWFCALLALAAPAQTLAETIGPVASADIDIYVSVAPRFTVRAGDPAPAQAARDQGFLTIPFCVETNSRADSLSIVLHWTRDRSAAADNHGNDPEAKVFRLFNCNGADTEALPPSALASGALGSWLALVRPE